MLALLLPEQTNLIPSIMRKAGFKTIKLGFIIKSESGIAK